MARVGGDEFAVIVEEDGTGKPTEHLIARVQSAFYKPVLILDVELHVTISAGATIMPRDSDSVGDAMRQVRHMETRTVLAEQAAGWVKPLVTLAGGLINGRSSNADDVDEIMSH